ncbi:VWA domain-containing protein, partial [Azospirillum doebereinerae]|nr:VWA domain-containing protein [Azospirillum doebereinerae]
MTSSPDGGRLALNLMHFARALRAAGLPVGPGKLLQAIEAVEAVGLGNRTDFYWALHAVLVDRHDQSELFDQAFHIFWRNPDILKRMMAMMLPTVRTDAAPDRPEMAQRLAEALHGSGPDPEGPEKTEIELDATFTVSATERLQEKDFETMTGAEMAQAKRLLTRLALPLAEVTTRRHRPDPGGPRLDPRGTL